MYNKSNPNLTKAPNKGTNNLKVAQAWQEFIGGDDSAFSLVYETYSKKMSDYGIAIGFCKELCKDAIQDVFCTICLSRKKLGHIENVEMYLLRCLKNRLFDIYKEEKRIRCINCDDVIIIDHDENVLNKITKKENLLLIKEETERLLKKLPPNHRKIILCRFNHNLKYSEIAAIMNMTPDAVKKQLYRSLKLMEQEVKSNSTNYYNTC